MTCGRVRHALTVVLLSTAASACPPYARQRPLVERMSPEVAPSRLRMLAAIAGGGSRTDLQISVTVRQQLNESGSGVTVFRQGGHFDTQVDAVRRVCNPAEAGRTYDGVLFVWYNRLELYDCGTRRAAYEISGGQLGITQMADRLILYLRRDTAAVPTSPP